MRKLEAFDTLDIKNQAIAVWKKEQQNFTIDEAQLRKQISKEYRGLRAYSITGRQMTSESVFRNLGW